MAQPISLGANTDIVDRMRTAAHIPIHELQRFWREVGPLAISEILLLRERESRRDTLPDPIDIKVNSPLRARARLYASGNRRK